MFDSNNSGSEQHESTIGTWIAIGAGLGVPLGLVLGNLALGIAIGLLQAPFRLVHWPTRSGSGAL